MTTLCPRSIGDLSTPLTLIDVRPVPFGSSSPSATIATFAKPARIQERENALYTYKGILNGKLKVASSPSLANYLLKVDRTDHKWSVTYTQILARFSKKHNVKRERESALKGLTGSARAIVTVVTVRDFQAPSTRIRIFFKTEIFFSVFEKICVHT